MFLSFLSSHSLPVCSECQGASVCSVTTVIAKQRAQGGPLLSYCQKLLGDGGGYFTAIPSPPLPVPSHLPVTPSPAPSGYIIDEQHNVGDVIERLNKAYTGVCVILLFATPS